MLNDRNKKLGMKKYKQKCFDVTFKVVNVFPTYGGRSWKRKLLFNGDNQELMTPCGENKLPKNFPRELMAY